MFWVTSVYFNVRNILPNSGIFPPGHPVYMCRQQVLVLVFRLVLSVSLDVLTSSVKKLSESVTGAVRHAVGFLKRGSAIEEYSLVGLPLQFVCPTCFVLYRCSSEGIHRSRRNEEVAMAVRE